MIQRAAAIIIDKSKILLIHRFKNDREYYVIPGGRVEKNESLEEAAIREAKEETNLIIKLDKKLFSYLNNNPSYNKKIQEHYFLAKNFRGKLRLGNPEKRRQSENNVYKLEWINFKDLKKINLVPRFVKMKLYNL